MKTPIVLTKVTMLYSPAEDRIRMTGRLNGQEAMVFWLTQRVCLTLVRAVGDFVEMATDFPLGADHELVLSFQQSAAMARPDASDPVVADACAESALVERIDIIQHADTALLFFFVRGNEQVQLSLSLQQARQWLGTLRAQFRLAAWSLETWPGWLIGIAEAQQARRGDRQIH